MILCAESLIVIAEIFAKISGNPRKRISDTAEWLKRYRESWLQSNKESELGEIEKMFTAYEAM